MIEDLLDFCFCFLLSASSQQRIFFIPYCFLVNSSTNYQCIYRLLPSFFKRVVSGFQPAVLSAACYCILTQDRDFRRGHRVDFSATSTDDGAPTVFYTAFLKKAVAARPNRRAYLCTQQFVCLSGLFSADWVGHNSTHFQLPPLQL